MARKRIAPQIEERVLVESRRRCCICYGLEKDLDIKAGQIAHLDGNAANAELDNLAFLCFAHHDEYDSSTSQRKGLTAREVRRFRRELHEIIDRAWKQPVRFGKAQVRAPGDVSGRYVRDGEFSSAELEVVLLAGGKAQVSGLALWGKGREYGPNIGELDFEAPIAGGKILFADGRPGDQWCYELTLSFDGDRLTAVEGYVVGYFGMNVSFEGEYRRVD